MFSEEKQAIIKHINRLKTNTWFWFITLWLTGFLTCFFISLTIKTLFKLLTPFQ